MYKEKELRALIALFFIVLVVSLFSCGYQESDGISNSNIVTRLLLTPVVYTVLLFSFF